MGHWRALLALLKQRKYLLSLQVITLCNENQHFKTTSSGLMFLLWNIKPLGLSNNHVSEITEM